MILVIGGTGTVGRQVLKRLAPSNAPVRVLVRNPAKAATLDLPSLEFVRGDLEDPSSLDRALVGVDRVMLLSPSSPRQVDLQGNLVRAATRTGRQPRIVKLSGLGPSPDRPVGRWHGQTERQIEEAGLPFTHIRPCFFMQNLLQEPRIVSHREFGLPAGDGAVAMVDVRDVAEVIVEALLNQTHEGRIYALTGPEPVTFTRAAEILSAVAGRQIIYRSIAPEAYKQELSSLAVPEELADAYNDMFDFYHAGCGAFVTDDIRRVTGHSPRTFAQFAQEYANAFRAD